MKSCIIPKYIVVNTIFCLDITSYATLKKHNGQKRTDHLKSENVKVETEIKEKVNRVMKIERVGKNYYLGEI